MKEVFSLGELYVSDFLKKDEQPTRGKEPLDLVMDNRLGAVRLRHVTDSDKMYGKYWYRSGISNTMRQELQEIALDAYTSIKTKEGDVFLDIACNDGTLLSFVPNTMKTVGIDPVEDSILDHARAIHETTIIQDYFSSEVYNKNIKRKAKIVTIIAMFYDLDDPVSFLREVSDILNDEGLLVIQMSYTPLMIRQLAFDNICHEHVYYHSLSSMQKILSYTDLEMVDCILNDVNGGSFRLYIRKHNANPADFKTAPYRDVARFRLDSYIHQENMFDRPTEIETYYKFFNNIRKLKKELTYFLEQEKAKGKVIWCYGASTKGNTLLQYFGLDNTIIEGIAERSEFKWGLRTVGTDIPIYSEDEMRKKHPDYLLVLPWHFINEFKEREKTYLSKGGKLIVPCPKFEIIG